MDVDAVPMSTTDDNNGGLKQTLGMATGVVAAITLVAAAAVGLGLIPSASEVRKVGEAVERVSATVEGRGARVAVVERDNAVQATQIANIEATVQRIEATQTAQFERVMDKLEAIDNRKRGRR